nr:MAG TPA: hypothetical protein [Caudoviricetes sp.]
MFDHFVFPPFSCFKASMREPQFIMTCSQNISYKGEV